MFDGAGSLTLPAATYTNVIRYKYNAVGLDSTFSSGGVYQSSMTYSLNAYMWLDESNPLTPLVFVWQEISYPSFGYYGKGISSVTYSHFPNTVVSGIENSAIANSFVIYPVPASDVLSIKLIGGNTQFSSLKIYDCLGRTIKEGSFTENVDVRDLEKGIYLIELKTNDGKFVTKKFTKE